MSATDPTADFDRAIRALAHPFRRKVLQWLADPDEYFTVPEYAAFRAVSAGMLHARSGLSQSTVSGHLAQLEHAGLIRSKKVGQWVFYSRNDVAMRELAEWFCADVAGVAEMSRVK
ncbi:metalloregulator ArsR/SmtB family transcription factor [Paraburkholderia phymatum]|uniref:Putative transcriptional regulator, ArsR family n=1 Tax=Paraburkholderia phymatum (strain DSM 17167 / CIP 108236 / LMG 21445 / STM815) TaxID=391038 RepID=B2JLD1_PARP8|nr:metalloregulator ArsR/SmtB family transcription factor [Paraburkholderia phymatum]ACC74099.1 putative transcriptional regulator, ArsR family [Paraburkholderia phymatum STM815]